MANEKDEDTYEKACKEAVKDAYRASSRKRDGAPLSDDIKDADAFDTPATGDEAGDVRAAAGAGAAGERSSDDTVEPDGRRWEDAPDTSKDSPDMTEGSAPFAGEDLSDETEDSADTAKPSGDRAESDLKSDSEGESEVSENGDDSAAKRQEKGKKIFSHKPKKDPKDGEIAALKDQVTRQLAEFDNFRKRTEKEKSASYELGVKSTVEKLLPIVDSFERGFQTVADEDKEDAFVKGMEMVQRQLLDALEAIGVKQIEAVGKEFNPDLHHAVMHVDDDSVGENTVVEEFQKGYTYHDSVVRYSMVKVAN